MTRRLARCPVCRRQVATLNDPTRLRAHYPKPYSWYDKQRQPLPDRYCPGSAKGDPR